MHREFLEETARHLAECADHWRSVAAKFEADKIGLDGEAETLRARAAHLDLAVAWICGGERPSHLACAAGIKELKGGVCGYRQCCAIEKDNPLAQANIVRWLEDAAAWEAAIRWIEACGAD